MEILFVPLEGVALYQTLLSSETSRNILQFYNPENLGYAVRIRTASLGTGLSLVSELRWYVRRYMREVLFEMGEGFFATYALAEEIYSRGSSIHELEGTAHLFLFHAGKPLEVKPCMKDAMEEEIVRAKEDSDLVILAKGPLRIKASTASTS